MVKILAKTKIVQKNAYMWHLEPKGEEKVQDFVGSPKREELLSFFFYSFSLHNTKRLTITGFLKVT